MEFYIIFMEQLMQGLEVYKLLDRFRENPVASTFFDFYPPFILRIKLIYSIYVSIKKKPKYRGFAMKY